MTCGVRWVSKEVVVDSVSITCSTEARKARAEIESRASVATQGAGRPEKHREVLEVVVVGGAAIVREARGHQPSTELALARHPDRAVVQVRALALRGVVELAEQWIVDDAHLAPPLALDADRDAEALQG